MTPLAVMRAMATLPRMARVSTGASSLQPGPCRPGRLGHEALGCGLRHGRAAHQRRQGHGAQGKAFCGVHDELQR